MSKNTLLGAVLQALNKERRNVRETGMMDILRRQGLTYANPEDNGYFLQETVRVGSDGSETTKYQLFKLVDEETITLTTELKKNVTPGITHRKLRDPVQRGPENKNTESSI